MTEMSVVQVSDQEAVIYRDAYQRREPEIRAVPDAVLVVPNVEAQHALTTTLQGFPSIQAMRPRLLKTFVEFDEKSLDGLADYAMSYLHCTTVNRAAAPETSPGTALLDDGVALCNAMGKDLHAAAERGRINGAPLKAAKGTAGYRQVADTLLIYAEVALTNWPILESKTHITKEEIHRAQVVAARINSFLADRAREEGMKSEAELLSQRAFTLFFKAFQSVRRDVAYVLEREGKGDQLDDIMPSIHNGWALRKRSSSPAPDAQPEPVAQPAPNAAPAAPTGALPGTGGRVGMPDSDPFTGS